MASDNGLWFLSSFSSAFPPSRLLILLSPALSTDGVRFPKFLVVVEK